MNTSRYTEAQILAILRQDQGGMPVAELCREHGISNAGLVAVWCRSFDSVMCSKGDELWAQSGRMNFARMRCGSR